MQRPVDIGATFIEVPDLEALRSAGRRDHEASFFFYDSHFARASVKVLPGEYFVHETDIVVTTTLGSCVSACLHDPTAGIGGMNHFMLPEGDGARFGTFAMELLIDEMIRRGSRRTSIEAKIFGGGQVVESLADTLIGDKNVAFVQAFLAQQRIPVTGADILGFCPRRICLFPRSGRVMCKILNATHGVESQLEKARYRARLTRRPLGGQAELLS